MGHASQIWCEETHLSQCLWRNHLVDRSRYLSTSLPFSLYWVGLDFNMSGILRIQWTAPANGLERCFECNENLHVITPLFTKGIYLFFPMIWSSEASVHQICSVPRAVLSHKDSRKFIMFSLTPGDLGMYLVESYTSSWEKWDRGSHYEGWEQQEWIPLEKANPEERATSGGILQLKENNSSLESDLPSHYIHLCLSGFILKISAGVRKVSILLANTCGHVWRAKISYI